MADYNDFYKDLEDVLLFEQKHFLNKTNQPPTVKLKLQELVDNKQLTEG